MRALRVTLYPPDLQEPVSMVLTEDDLQCSVEEALQEQLSFGLGFVVCEVFETGGDLMDAVLEAGRRQAVRRQRESDMALLFYYDAAHLRMVAEGGLLTTSEPAPLSADEITSTLRQLAEHPDYRNQVVVVHAEDGSLVQMSGGEINVVGHSEKVPRSW